MRAAAYLHINSFTVRVQGSVLRTCFLVDKHSKEPVEKISLKQGDTVVLYGSADQSKDAFIGWAHGGDFRIGVGYEYLVAAAPTGTILRLDNGALLHPRARTSSLLCLVSADLQQIALGTSSAQ